MGPHQAKWRLQRFSKNIGERPTPSGEESRRYFDCDAIGCYDWILPPLASVHLRHLGLSKSISTFLAKMMHYTRRHVKSKHGISKHNIKTTNRQILHGIGQGNGEGGGPAIWLAHGVAVNQ